MSEAASEQWVIDLPDEAATRSLAVMLAGMVGAGDLVTLSGDLGAGKTTFARAMIRRLVDDEKLETPSPTFTLMQVYEGAAFPIVHADLYRIADPAELAELGWDEATDRALVLVEWAERAGGLLAADHIDVALTIPREGAETRRRATLTGAGSYAPAIARAKAIAGILRTAGWADASRAFMLGDASTRAYERLTKPNGSTAILMISPPRPDGPPVRFGKPYSAIARLAENIRPFVAMSQALRAQGLSAPQVYAADLDQGYAVLEDLGAEGVVDANGPIVERYEEAAGVLAHLHGRALPDLVDLADGSDYRIPPYDLDALLIEVELLVEWYAPHIARAGLSSGQRAIFINLWRHAALEIAHAAPTWTLRDYHSPNILWLPQREGLQRIGVIDFQDCVMGHPAYDLVSLLQDARVTVPDDVELRLLSRYMQMRRAQDAHFDMAAFARAYAVLGAQRATKILGIFARLDKRDRKPHYLAHMPRVSHYLRKNMKHPALAELRGWFEAHLPRLLEER
ncbi:MAG: tRNA (adenosine(37)-N6)-threonylcarbamoyltransferase complex ATPase subunit type 1 TsaE [Hyphomicrobiales bacterium]|nr:tRNA (adenosine(37)-N6)-threonylcarbamoyltransferase complex ATPase subunit type 1 TsaE [Hyphomicrobiales bacterium]